MKKLIGIIAIMFIASLLMFATGVQAAPKKGGTERIRCHDLRHTDASQLIGRGENNKYIPSQSGHSSPSVTSSVYAHLMKPVKPGGGPEVGKFRVWRNRSQFGHNQ